MRTGEIAELIRSIDGQAVERAKRVAVLRALRLEPDSGMACLAINGLQLNLSLIGPKEKPGIPMPGTEFVRQALANLLEYQIETINQTIKERRSRIEQLLQGIE